MCDTKWTWSAPVLRRSVEGLHQSANLQFLDKLLAFGIVDSFYLLLLELVLLQTHMGNELESIAIEGELILYGPQILNIHREWNMFPSLLECCTGVSLDDATILHLKVVEKRCRLRGERHRSRNHFCRCMVVVCKVEDLVDEQDNQIARRFGFKNR